MVRDIAQDRTGVRRLRRHHRGRTAHHGADGGVHADPRRHRRLDVFAVRIRGVALPDRDPAPAGLLQQAVPGLGGRRARPGAPRGARVRRGRAVPSGRLDPPGRRVLRIRRAEHPRGAARRLARAGGGRAVGHRGAVRLGQVDPRPARGALLRRDVGHGIHRRRRCARHRLRRSAGPCIGGVPEDVPHQRDGRRQHPHGFARPARPGAGRRAPGPGRRLHHGAPPRIRHAHRHAGGRSLRRRAPAHRHCPRHAEGRPHPRTGRGDERSGPGEPGPHRRGAGQSVRRQDGARRRAPPRCGRPMRPGRGGGGRVAHLSGDARGRARPESVLPQRVGRVPPVSLHELSRRREGSGRGYR